MSCIASDALIASAMAKLGMTAPLPNLDDSQVLKAILVALGNVTTSGDGGSGTVTAFAFTNSNGITGVVTTPNTTPTLELTLGAIIPTTVNGLTLTSGTGGFNISSGVLGKALTVSNTITLQGTDGSTFNIGAGGTLGSAAYTAASAYAPAASVTGGGVIATGGFTLTVPATGTAQLIGSTLALAGFSSITGILPSVNGGTGVANSGTLTNASSTTITGGGTLALGGFTLTVPATGTTALLGTANVFSVNGALSAPAVSLTGTAITGGTSTTTKPLFLIEPTGTASTGWSTAGTMFGVNAASGFTGRLASFQLAGTEKAYIRNDGAIASGGNVGLNTIYDPNLNVALAGQATVSGVNGFYVSAFQLVGPWCISSPQALSGAGAVNLTTTVTKFTSTGAAQALTLADGIDGQIKIITHVVAGGTGILTPTTKTGFTTITFNAAGDSVTLRFNTTIGWVVDGFRGVTIA